MLFVDADFAETMLPTEGPAGLSGFLRREGSGRMRKTAPLDSQILLNHVIGETCYVAVGDD